MIGANYNGKQPNNTSSIKNFVVGTSAVLWKVINDTIKDLLLPIPETYDLAKITLGESIGKVLIKWKQYKTPEDSKHNLFRPDLIEVKNNWSHFRQDNSHSIEISSIYIKSICY